MSPLKTLDPVIPIEIAGLAPNLVPYEEGLALQREAFRRVAEDGDRGTAFLLEHEPVYTAGARALPEEYPDDGTPVVPTDRGGKVTWHGPGQLVGYPVVRLRDSHRVVDFVRGLEGVLIDAVAGFGVRAYRIAGRAGVWADAGGSPVKFGQIGLRMRAGIVTHGFALNCSNSLAPFDRFIPCGISDAGVSTVSALTGAPVTPRDVVAAVGACLSGLLQEVAA